MNIKTRTHFVAPPRQKPMAVWGALGGRKGIWTVLPDDPRPGAQPQATMSAGHDRRDAAKPRKHEMKKHSGRTRWLQARVSRPGGPLSGAITPRTRRAERRRSWLARRLGVTGRSRVVPLAPARDGDDSYAGVILVSIVGCASNIH
jgi:hypothetical protein